MWWCLQILEETYKLEFLYSGLDSRQVATIHHVRLQAKALQLILTARTRQGSVRTNISPYAFKTSCGLHLYTDVSQFVVSLQDGHSHQQLWEVSARHRVFSEVTFYLLNLFQICEWIEWCLMWIKVVLTIQEFPKKKTPETWASTVESIPLLSSVSVLVFASVPDQCYFLHHLSPLYLLWEVFGINMNWGKWATGVVITLDGCWGGQSWRGILQLLEFLN